MTDIAIIIVNYNMHLFVRDCLASLAPQIASSHLRTRIIVVDNASDTPIHEVVEASSLKNITVVANKENRGYAAGVNAGIRAVQAHYYLVINPDIVFFEQDTLDRLFTFMETHPTIGMVGPKLLNPDGSLQYSCWRFPETMMPLYRRTALGNTSAGKRALKRFRMEEWDHGQTQPVECIMGSAMMVRATSLEKVGLMSEDYFMYFEDMDWCRRFWVNHIPIYYIHNIRLRHQWRRDSARIPGVKGLIFNPLARVHVVSWMKYMWKWR